MESPAYQSNQLDINSRIEREPLNGFHRGEICPDWHLIYITLSFWCKKCLNQLRYSSFNNVAECEVNEHKMMKRKELLIIHIFSLEIPFELITNTFIKMFIPTLLIADSVIVHKFSPCQVLLVLALFIFKKKFFLECDYLFNSHKSSLLSERLMCK